MHHRQQSHPAAGIGAGLGCRASLAHPFRKLGVSVGGRLARSIASGHFEAIFENAPAAMFAIDLDTTLLLFNERSERLFGFARAELLGGSVDRLTAPDHAGKLSRILLSPASSASTSVARRKDGREVMLELEWQPLELDGVPLVLASALDVTERTAAEARSRAAIHEKSLLVSEVHHRVKNNLQIICSLLQLQKARVSDPQLIEILSDSYARVVSMALVHQALCQAPNVASVNFRYFLEMLVARLRELHAGADDGGLFEFESVDLTMTMERAMPCGLAANELLADALRQSVHAGVGLKVSLSTPDRTSGCLHVRCTEPIDPRLHRETDEFSWRLIELLVAQARGRLQVDDLGGRSCAFTFPIHTASED